MEIKGINTNLSFILNENSPILEIRNNKVEESGKKLLKGTIVDGQLKTRVVNISGQKIAYKFIELKDKKGYISPQVVSLYIGTFANSDGNSKDDKTPVKKTAFGETDSKNKRTKKNYFINYGLPILGGVVGYQIAKKMGADDKKKLSYVLFFGLLGWLPRYIYKTK